MKGGLLCSADASAQMTNMDATLQIYFTQQTMLYGHVDPTFWNIYTKMQPTASSNSYVIIKYVSENNLPTKLGIYIIYPKYLTSIYMCHI